MPANLPPEYFEAEKRFKQASTTAEKIASLEALISTVPKHKGTDKLRADLRRRLSQLRKEATTKKRGSRTNLYIVNKEGAAQIALVGLPNSGKSSLLACLTNATPVIADYPISTIMPLPGMMPYEDIQIQIIDLPPIGNEATDGWVSGLLRNADALILILDLSEDPDVQAELLIDQLERWNIFLIVNSASIEQNSKSKVKIGVFKRALIVANKRDLEGSEEAFEKVRKKYGDIFKCISISTKKKENLEELKHAIFKLSGIIRVYSKPPGKDPDFSMPFTIPEGSTILDLAEIIHKDFLFNLKFARVWGSAKFEGQRVAKNYVLKDKDIVEINV